mmetsp:Transcript_105082/g.263199  ORF Transcript_105082/g.263199 Transcript_105082/m.263199 type:complete len:348 (+) Transcript_105082:550-1593(+)
MAIRSLGVAVGLPHCSHLLGSRFSCAAHSPTTTTPSIDSSWASSSRLTREWSACLRSSCWMRCCRGSATPSTSSTPAAMCTRRSRSRRPPSSRPSSPSTPRVRPTPRGSCWQRSLGCEPCTTRLSVCCSPCFRRCTHRAHCGPPKRWRSLRGSSQRSSLECLSAHGRCCRRSCCGQQSSSVRRTVVPRKTQRRSPPPQPVYQMLCSMTLRRHWRDWPGELWGRGPKPPCRTSCEGSPHVLAEETALASPAPALQRRRAAGPRPWAGRGWSLALSAWCVRWPLREARHNRSVPIFGQPWRPLCASCTEGATSPGASPRWHCSVVLMVPRCCPTRQRLWTASLLRARKP